MKPVTTYGYIIYDRTDRMHIQRIVYLNSRNQYMFSQQEAYQEYCDREAMFSEFCTGENKTEFGTEYKFDNSSIVFPTYCSLVSMETMLPNHIITK